MSSEYPKKTGTSKPQNVTYDKKMNFSVKATFDLNNEEFVVISFRNVNSGVEVDVRKYVNLPRVEKLKYKRNFQRNNIGFAECERHL